MKTKKILISPLYWGFGHAGRMIPLARALSSMGHKVVFGAAREMIPYLGKELPGVDIIYIPGAQMNYSRYLPQYLCIFFSIPRLIISALRENRWLKKMSESLQPDIIISDNRFGFYSKNAVSVYVTHMLRVPFPALLRFLEPLAQKIHTSVIKRYDLCLIPDYPDKPDLAGRLSHISSFPLPVIYCGPLSRFTGPRHSSSYPEIDSPFRCLILSGPEPQRSVLMNKVIESSGDHTLVILGGTAEPPGAAGGNVRFISMPETSEMRHYIENSEMVIGRSGYTTIMELCSLNKGALLIPTPGQTEQEYLAEYLAHDRGFVFLKQKEIGSLSDISPDALQWPDKLYADSATLLRKAIDIILKKEYQREYHNSETCK